MDQQRLDYALQQHENYVRTDGKAGEPADLSYQDLSGCVIENRSMLTGLKLDWANLERAKILNCNLEGVSLTHSYCLTIHIVGTLLPGANFEYADLRGAQILQCGSEHPNWSDHNIAREGKDLVNFSMADLHQARIHMSDLSGAILRGAKMDAIYLRFVNLNGANLSSASMERATTRHASIHQANCTDLNAAHGDLCGLSFNKSDLTGADFSYSFIGDADVGGAHGNSTFIGTNLERSIFVDAELRYCDLTGATFRNALLKRCKFAGCTLEGTNFINAKYLKKTSFDMDFSGSINKGHGRVAVKLITTPASVDKINDALTESGYSEQVELGLTGKLKLINFVKGSNLYNPFPDKTIGRLYTSFFLGKRPDSVDDVITQENLADYSVADVLFGIKWLIYQSAQMSE